LALGSLDEIAAVAAAHPGSDVSLPWSSRMYRIRRCSFVQEGSVVSGFAAGGEEGDFGEEGIVEVISCFPGYGSWIWGMSLVSETDCR